MLILIKYKDGDANVRSVWLCSRNDAMGNVAAILASLFLSSAINILRPALDELVASLDVRDSEIRVVRRKECTG